jgi:citrate lyase synthetase
MEINFKGKKKKYRFTTDGMQYSLYEVTKNKKGDVFSAIGHYSKIENALERLLMLEIAESGATTFKELLDAVREAREFINTIVSEKTKP